MKQITHDLDDGRWARHVANVDVRMKDEELYLALKMGLIDHIWAEDGRCWKSFKIFTLFVLKFKLFIGPDLKREK